MGTVISKWKFLKSLKLIVELTAKWNLNWEHLFNNLMRDIILFTQYSREMKWFDIYEICIETLKLFKTLLKIAMCNRC